MVAYPPITGVSVCSGTGGLDLGLKIPLGQAFKPVLYVEREAYTAACLAQKMADGALPPAPIWSDIKTICGPEVRHYLRVALRGRKLGILFGGIPCQPFSNAGRRRGKNDERHLWPFFRDAVEEHRPAAVFVENVPGLVGLGLQEIGDDLRALGYSVAAGLFTASEVGCSHKRERLFILAVANSECDSRPGRGIAGNVAVSTRGTEAGGQQRQWMRNTTEHGGADLGHSVSAGRPLGEQVANEFGSISYQTHRHYQRIQSDGDKCLNQHQNSHPLWSTPRADSRDNCGGSNARKTMIKAGGYTGRKLNPLFVDWLMNLIPGWNTVSMRCGQAETESYLCAQRLRLCRCLERLSKSSYTKYRERSLFD